MLLSQTSLGELYQSLSSDELKDLSLYLQKNTVGRENMTLSLHKYFCEALYTKQLARLETEDVKSKLFGGDARSTSKLTTYNNLLTNHIKEFLLLSKIREKNIYTETLWGEILIERRLSRNLLLKISNFKFDLYSDDYSLMKRYYHDRELVYYHYTGLTRKNYVMVAEELKQMISSFKNYVQFTLLEAFNSYIPLSNKVNSNSSKYEDEIRTLLSDCINANNDILKIKSFSVKLSFERTKQSYQELKEFFLNNVELWSMDTCIQIIPILYNYAHSSVNKGLEEFELENYNFLNSIHIKNLIFKKGVFTIGLVINFIRLELRFGTIEKAEELLQESLKVMPQSQKDSYQYLVESRINFAKQDYKLSLRKILTINPSDSIYYYPLYKIMLIKCHIMLADIDRLMAERENFYKYIQSHKNIQEDEKRRHKLFIKYSEYLTQARYDYLTDYMKRRIEQALLPTSPYFTEKPWVRERWEYLSKTSEKE